ncbi:MAG: hypothetical protein LBR80_14960 [Deltaproteobacteria bacterium]|jgi:uncharacterized membrane protein YagU involved in acid resistance|nr:hypothetical protein [Deltaproteobacteria bacterium]
MLPRRYVNARLELLDRSAMALCLAVTAATYLLYVFHNDLLMSAAQASDVLAGFEMFRAKSLVLTDWSYGSEVFTLRSPLFVALFSAFTDNMIWAHRISVIFELALETAAMIYMLNRLDLRGRPGVIALALFFGARSYQSGIGCGMGFSQDASFYVCLFLTVGYCAASATAVRGRAEKILKFALPVAAFLFGLSSIILFAILYFPLLICYAARAAASSRGTGITGQAARVSGKGQSSAGGSPVRPATTVNPGRLPERALFREVAVWNIMFIMGYLTLSFGVASRGLGPVLLGTGPSVGFQAMASEIPPLIGQFVDWTPLLSIKGAVAIRSWGWLGGWSFLFFIGYAAWMTPRAIREAGGPAGDAVRALGVCLASAFVFMTVHLESALVSIRYLMFVLVFAAVLLAWLYREIELVNGGLARLLLFCIAFTVVTNCANNMTGLGWQIEMGQSVATSKYAETVSRILAERGVNRVYALFWDSYNLEVLSGGRLKVAAVDGRMRPFIRNTSILNYAGETAADRTAFVFSRNPRTWAPDALNLQDATLLDAAEETVRIEDPDNPVFVCVFPDNPFTFDAAAERAFLTPAEEGAFGIGGDWEAQVMDGGEQGTSMLTLLSQDNGGAEPVDIEKQGAGVPESPGAAWSADADGEIPSPETVAETTAAETAGKPAGQAAGIAAGRESDRSSDTDGTASDEAPVPGN